MPTEPAAVDVSVPAASHDPVMAVYVSHVKYLDDLITYTAAQSERARMQSEDAADRYRRVTAHLEDLRNERDRVQADIVRAFPDESL